MFKDWLDFRDSIIKAVRISTERGQLNTLYLEDELEKIYKDKLSVK